MHLVSKQAITFRSFFLDLLKAHPLGIRKAGPIYQVQQKDCVENCEDFLAVRQNCCKHCGYHKSISSDTYLQLHSVFGVQTTESTEVEEQPQWRQRPLGTNNAQFCVQQ